MAWIMMSFTPACLREFHHGDELVLMAVDAAVGNQADEMQARGFRFFQGVAEHRIGGQRAFFDRLVDAGEILIDDAARAEIEVADFGIAHLPGRQADIQAGGAEEAFRVLFQHHVMERRVGEQHGVAVFDCGFFSSGIHTPAVANDEHYWFLSHDGAHVSRGRARGKA